MRRDCEAVFSVIARSESDEAIHSFFGLAGMDCFAALAMTRIGLAAYSGGRVGKGALAPCLPSIGSLIPQWWARFHLRSASYGGHVCPPYALPSASTQDIFRAGSRTGPRAGTLP